MEPDALHQRRVSGVEVGEVVEERRCGGPEGFKEGFVAWDDGLHPADAGLAWMIEEAVDVGVGSRDIKLIFTADVPQGQSR
ncbi:hypothetical protein OPT61_g9168 [Boeremia exigua]|uniref:Uncharacterized protein n=1 Tax=Boeremia exigua TaxID=749465 RepID=A0ACC2HW43_9PLEO|nr:hypothetical protein OPT61_g9168 [Boeremia exigua]